MQMFRSIMAAAGASTPFEITNSGDFETTESGSVRSRCGNTLKAPAQLYEWSLAVVGRVGCITGLTLGLS